ncbi:MAG TPA: TonB-dependent receptor [Kofleriaceae bacterium]
MIMLVAAGSAHAQSQSTQEHVEAPTSNDATASGAPVLPDAPIAIDQLTLSDDLIGALGLRPIASGRIEALISAGNESTQHAALRATEKLGGVGFELTGNALDSDALGTQTEVGARIEHAGERNRLRLLGRYANEYVGLTRQAFESDLATTSYGGAWTGWRSAGRIELEAYGSHQTLRDTGSLASHELDADAYAAHAGWSSRRVHAFGLDHAFGADIDITSSSSTTNQTDLSDEMQTNMQTLARTRRGRHRFLRAYIHDTIRVIESLDVHTGFVFEQWRWLTNIAPIYAQDFGEGMDVESAGSITDMVMGPQLGASYRVTPTVALQANAYRRLRTPTWQQLMRPVQNGDVLTVPSEELRPETVTGGQFGPTIELGAIEARAVVFVHDIASPIVAVTSGPALRETTNLDHAREAGVDAEARWRIGKPWLAGIGYTFTDARVTAAAAHAQLVGNQLAQTPRHRATALLAFDDPKLVTITGAVRYADRRFEDDRNMVVAPHYAVVDAMAARKLWHGLAGFVAVENLFDRRYVANQAGVETFSAPRLVQIGLRLDSARW